MKALHRWILKYLLALGVCALLFLFVDLRELKILFLSLTPGVIALLLFLSFILVYASALKWKLFLEVLGEGERRAVSLASLIRLYLIGYFVNLAIPSYVGGDVVRSYYVGTKVGQYNAAAATFLERYTGLIAMLILALVFMWFSPLITWQIQCAVIGIVAGVGTISLLALKLTPGDRFSKLPGFTRVWPHFEKIRAAVKIAREHPSLWWKTLGLSFVFHALTVLNTLSCAYAGGWYDVPIPELFVVLPLILLIGALPIAPSGLGIQEGAFFYFLQGLGATPAQALAVGLLLRGKLYALSLIGGVLWLLRRREKFSTAEAV